MAVQEADGKQTAMRIDMNSDMGESFGRWTLGDDEALLDVVSSANVACGFHAGDPSVMLRTLSYAASRGGGVMVGAHVAYRDLAGFGRRYVDESPDELKADVMYQIVEYGGLDGVHMTNVATVDGLEPDRYFKQVGQLTDCARS
ncbi:LamB/YcsF family protein [Bifidobacterium adolescentis]|uniref:LamB/YcsF family protein n=3 Tax=Bifidobacterium adolescentis TaxID=1680 RepID=UPI00214BC861